MHSFSLWLQPGPLGLGSRISWNLHQPPLAASGHRDPPQTNSVRQVPPGPRQAAASNLEAVRRSLSEAGFSKEGADRIAAPQALSTKSVYGREWRIFVLGVVDERQIFLLPLFS